MIEINIKRTFKNFKFTYEFRSFGHCEHDVCVAVTAILSGLHAYILKLNDDGAVKVVDRVYDEGKTSIEFEVPMLSYFEIRSGIDAFITALELYKYNYPDKLKIWVYK